MTAKKLLYLFLLLMCQNLVAQNDSIIGLQEVVVSDMQLRKFSATQNMQIFNDSVIDVNAPSLTSLLNYNSSIYFKENGYGMVASASFRGTTAQQTAVVWNGININSNFNGQTDFNTIQASSFDEISVRSGGGSVLYGSSAIGGSVHLNNELRFSDNFGQKIRVGYGSFNTLRTDYEILSATDRWSVKAAVARNSSDNDYEFSNGRKNLNGQFENLSFSADAAYKINKANMLQFHSIISDGTKNLSLVTPTDTRTAYDDFTTRNLMEWTNSQSRLTSTLKAAFLTEQYRFYPNINSRDHVGSTAETLIGKYDLSYKLGSRFVVNAIADYSTTSADGSDLSGNKREVASATILIKHNVSQAFEYEAGIRKEITNSYDSPLLFSAGVKYNAAKWYSVKFNASRNFRIPTFNDLYWLEGGNTNLRPESSYQAEVGNDFDFGFAKLSVTGYYMQISDMIQWLPGTTTLWFPQNVADVNAYGLEASATFKKDFAKNRLSADATYVYTVSENAGTGYQLIYVPFHKATTAFAYSRGALTATWQTLFNGAVFTRSDNNANHTIDPYSVSNFSACYRIGTNEMLTLGFRVLNVFDQVYEVVDNRPFPGRNYNIYLIFTL